MPSADDYEIIEGKPFMKLYYLFNPTVQLNAFERLIVQFRT
jgi:hypothetical protein